MKNLWMNYATLSWVVKHLEQAEQVEKKGRKCHM